jgi:hypothetical protein
MGFEPTTFCMASSRSATPRAEKRLQIATCGRLDTRFAFQELCGDTGGLDKEQAMSDPQRLVGGRVRTSLSSPPRLRQSGSPIPAAPTREGPRRTTPAIHRRRGSTSACPRDQLRRRRRSRQLRAPAAPAARAGPGWGQLCRAPAGDDMHGIATAVARGRVREDGSLAEHAPSAGSAPSRPRLGSPNPRPWEPMIG